MGRLKQLTCIVLDSGKIDVFERTFAAVTLLGAVLHACLLFKMAAVFPSSNIDLLPAVVIEGSGLRAQKGVFPKYAGVHGKCYLSSVIIDH